MPSPIPIPTAAPAAATPAIAPPVAAPTEVANPDAPALDAAVAASEVSSNKPVESLYKYGL